MWKLLRLFFSVTVRLVVIGMLIVMFNLHHRMMQHGKTAVVSAFMQPLD